MLQLRFFVFFVLLAPLWLSAQTLPGRVLIAGTETPIAGASVYYNATMLGTATNDKGEFTLTEKNDHPPLIISCVGYATAQLNDYDSKHLLIVYLTPKIEALRTVVIGLDGMKRKEKEKIFLTQFLGSSVFAKGCTITNLKDVELIYRQKTKTLIAVCDTPLQIINKALGYQITYFLEEFKFSPGNTHFLGNYIYKDVFLPAEQGKILKNRDDAYQFSRLRFIRSLWADKLEQDGYSLVTTGYRPLTEDSITRMGSGLKYIDLKGKNLLVLYGRYSTDLAQTAPVYINSAGFYGAGLEWHNGKMADQRLGDMLPFEYWPGNNADHLIYKTPTILAVSQPIGSNKSLETAAVQTVSKSVKDISNQTNDKTVPLFFEKAYLHTDRDVYAQGEDIWFKAYLVNAQTNQLINYSRNLYVELINPAAKIIGRKMLRLEDGLSNGDLKLADTLTPGTYRLRAYTNWMRNFGDNFIFEKRVSILPDVLATRPVTSPAIKTNGKDILKTVILAIPDTATTPTVSFFPEGGSLITGITAIVAVKAADAHGRGTLATGQVLNAAGDSVASFSCDSLGMGSFTLLPMDRQPYRASVIINGQKLLVKLPPVAATGFGMRVQPKPPFVKIVISCNDVTFGQNSGQHIYLTVKHAGKTYVRESLLLNNKNLLVNIPDSLLVSGINAVTITDENRQPLAERLIYTPNTKRVSADLTKDKAIYQPKDKVTLHIKLSNAGKANLSLAAVDAMVIPVQSENIRSYLELTSEVKGDIERPDRYFDTTNTNRYKQLDLLLLTQGWRNFVWKRLEDTVLKINREVEQGITLTGRVTKTSGKGKPSGVDVTMRAPGAVGQKLFYASTDTAGRFSMDGPLFYGYQYLYFTSRQFNKKGQVKSDSGGWVQVDSLKQDTLPVHQIKQSAADTLPSDAEILARLHIPKQNQLKQVDINAEVLHKYPPEIHSITQAEQKDFGTVRQYLVYIIEEARLQLKEDGELWLVTGYDPKTRLGIPVNISSSYADGSKIDHNTAYKQDPLDFPMSQILTATIQKTVGFDGLVHYRAILKLRPGAFNMDTYFDNTTANLTGYYKARVFYTPKFGSIDNNTDPRRNTIHWQPNIVTDSNGEADVSFFTTDRKGDIRLTLQGITQNGEAVVATGGYYVK